MDAGQMIPTEGKRKKEAGQTLVEFVLLLLVITMVSFGFLRTTNGNLAKFWMGFARVIVDDPSQNGILNL